MYYKKKEENMNTKEADIFTTKILMSNSNVIFTGTFITTDISLRRLEHLGNVDISQTVRKIRSQRAFSIQMPDQFVFCHFAVIEHAMRQGEMGDIDWEGFDDSDSDED